MVPEKLLEEYCLRYGVSAEFAKRFLPLLERASQVKPEVREKMLQLIRTSFEKEAERRALGRMSWSAADLRLIKTIASVLHGWIPPAWAMDWGENRGRRDPDRGEEAV